MDLQRSKRLKICNFTNRIIVKKTLFWMVNVSLKQSR